MKRTVIALSMLALVAIPCFGQEIEPDASFLFDGTRWRSCGIERRVL